MKPLLVLAALASAGVTMAASPTASLERTTFDQTVPSASAVRIESIDPVECRPPLVAAPEFYVIELVTTRRIPGSGAATGRVDVTFTPSPFGISLTENGDYLRDVEINVSNLRPSDQGVFVVWLTTPQLDRIERVGVLGDGPLRGQVRWNKFLVVISLEQDDASSAPRWAGPIVLRGMSRSGAMHTSAGHGPFETENCASYGFRE